MSLFNTRSFSYQTVTSANVEGEMVETFGPIQTGTGSIQPLKGRDLENLPELRERGASYWIYTKTELRTALEGSHNSDHVVFNGKTFEVIKCEPWENSLINHFKVLVSLI